MKKYFKEPQQLATATASQIKSRQIFAPGNRFSLDLCQQVEFTPIWQMPKLSAVTADVPESIMAYYRIGSNANPKVWAHCFTDDRRLMPFLNQPYKMARMLKKNIAVIGLDLSIKPEMLLSQKIAISFYNKLISAFWQHQGLTVVQNVVWAESATFAPCFDGYAKHTLVAVNSTGIGTDKRSCYIWDQGYEAMLEVLRPTLIIRYGAKRSGERTDISVYYENDNKLSARYGW